MDNTIYAKNLADGQVGYITPWMATISEDGSLLLCNYVDIWPDAGGTTSIKVRRVGDNIFVSLPDYLQLFLSRPKGDPVPRSYGRVILPLLIF